MYRNLRAICSLFFDRFSGFILAIAAIFLVSVGVFAEAPNTSSAGIVAKLQDALLSGEVVGLVLAGVGGYFFNRWREADRRRQEEAQKQQEINRQNEIELGRLRFKQESFEATKKAVTEGMSSVTKQFDKSLLDVRQDLDELTDWVKKIDGESEKALRLSELNQKTQEAWLRAAEARISAVLSANDNPTIAGRLFCDIDENDGDEYKQR